MTLMDYEHLLVADQNSVRTITLNRPTKRNALSEKLREELESCLNEAAANENVRVVILTGGERVFSAGFDLTEAVATELRTFEYRAVEFHTAIYGFPKPLIVAVSGPAMAGGFDLALAGDIILASDTALFGHPEVSFGVPALVAPLARRVGLARAKTLLFTGAMLKPQDALGIGLVDRVVPVADLMAEARLTAEKIASLPALPLRLMKQAAEQVSKSELTSAVARELHLLKQVIEDAATVAIVRAYAAEKGIQ